VNLEGHNLGVLSTSIIPEPVEVIAMDLSYLALADAVPQLDVLSIESRADLLTLVNQRSNCIVANSPGLLHRSTTLWNEQQSPLARVVGMFEAFVLHPRPDERGLPRCSSMLAVVLGTDRSTTLCHGLMTSCGADIGAAGQSWVDHEDTSGTVG
jgi:hypothetical protein